ncbi:MAG: hypothetical protein PWP31_1818 [Clostridia bacterium]|nr:hypothetical protein [Clostridia bacterium]
MSRAIISGLLYSLLIGFMLALLLSLALFFTTLSEGYLPIISKVIIALAVFCGGVQAARVASSRGLIHGVGVGISFFLVVLVLSWTNVTVTLTPALAKFGLCLISGATGGVAGMTGQ